MNRKTKGTQSLESSITTSARTRADIEDGLRPEKVLPMIEQLEREINNAHEEFVENDRLVVSKHSHPLTKAKIEVIKLRKQYESGSRAKSKAIPVLNKIDRNLSDAMKILRI